MFSVHVIFIPHKLHVRLEDYIWNLEITCLNYHMHLISDTCNLQMFACLKCNKICLTRVTHNQTLLSNIV